MENEMNEIERYIKMFVAQKRASGYPYNTSQRLLHNFANMIKAQYPDSHTVTSDMIESWINLKKNENPNGLLRRISPIRQFTKYLNGIGVPAFIVPDHIPERRIKYEAHIYTKEELIAFFKAIDSVRYSDLAPTRSFVIPVIFRYYYCCGLRSSEARLLTVNDVDLQTGKIMIRESKGWHSRIIYMSDDLLRISREYDGIMQELCPDRIPFFPNKEGAFYAKGIQDIWFHEFWDRYHVNDDIPGNSPRVHDFRHTYAVDRLNKWVRSGENVEALYPSFSQYMGHVKFADTDYYLHLSESFYPEMEQKMSSMNEDILPEVTYE